MTNALVVPFIVPVIGAGLVTLAGRRPRAAAGIALAVLATVLGTTLSLIQVVSEGVIPTLRMGSWPPGIAIVFAADRLSVAMLGLSAFLGPACYVYAVGCPGFATVARPFTALFLIMMAGVNGSFLTGDFFNMFVCFELMLLASYGLFALRADLEQIRGTFRYMLINITVSTSFLLGVGLLYGSLGTVNMALASRTIEDMLSRGALPASASAAVAMLIAVFSAKGALFPLYLWLPEAYPRGWPPTSGIISGLLTKVGVYALYRTLSLCHGALPGITDWLLWISAATMLLGVLSAVSQDTIRRILSFHIVSQIGYMIFALGLWTPLALAGGLFYIVHHVIVKTGLFLVGGIVETRRGTGDLSRLGGLSESFPLLGAGFMLVALSLAGVPPLSGFYGKFLLLIVALKKGAYLVAAISLLTSLLTLFSMMKIWRYAFWREPTEVLSAREPVTGEDEQMGMGIGLGIVVVLSLTVMLGAPALMSFAEAAAQQLLDPMDYLNAVLTR